VDDVEESFRVFVGARLPALKRTAWWLVGDIHLAQDLVQTALSKAAMR
jgi:DNA-directed RNA polymerase specialized sigma24 family protein